MKQFDNLVILLLKSIPTQRPAIKPDTAKSGTKKQEHCGAGAKQQNTHKHTTNKKTPTETKRKKDEQSSCVWKRTYV